jgi:dCTP deaminase
MYLSDHDIHKAIEKSEISISDFSLDRLQPASYDIRLGDKFLIVKEYSIANIDPVNHILPEYEEIVVTAEQGLILRPWVTVLGTSIEKFGSEKYLIQLSGKSSLARIGLIVHNTAGLINPGHYLNITFELANMNSVPIILRPGMDIAQLLFAEMTSPPSQDYREIGRYGEGEENMIGYIKKDSPSHP